jgi:prephenate dehydrogenase
MAVRRHLPDWEVRVWTRESSLVRVREVFSEATSDVVAAARGADLIVLCTPVGSMNALAGSLCDVLFPEAVVTDAASVKGAVCAGMEEIFGDRFLGAHPMAGSERSGLSAARGDLFEGATCFVTPGTVSGERARRVVPWFWESVGCRIRELGPAEHDRLVARASHLPHAVAGCLVRALDRFCPEAGTAIGPGFRDTTRVAGGPAAMWAEIFQQNRGNVMAALTEFRQTLDEFEGILASGDEQLLENELAEARRAREAFL